jgi:outer membrane lipopolysaccharide assembly protein LptE/RlpB
VHRDRNARACESRAASASASRVPARVLCAALLLISSVAAGCGYTVAGRATRIPPDVHTIAVLPLVNKTSTYRIEQRMTSAVVREFLERTKYRIVPADNDADAVLSGEISSIEASAVTYDYTTGRATTMLVTVTMKVRLEDRDHKVLYENNNYVFRQPYEISTDVTSFFQEEGPALDRMSQDFASRLVADVLENY